MPTERLLIVSKTNMYNAICVGAINSKGESRRLLQANGENQPRNTPLKIGDVWLTTFEFPSDEKLRKPHTEDVYVSNLTYEKSYRSIVSFLKPLQTIWRKSLFDTFGGLLQVSNGGSLYIQESTGIPACSTGFWYADRDLVFEEGYYWYQYYVKSTKIKYVGLEEPLINISTGTLVRLSLARWWTPDHSPERCYLQISGWYK